MSIFKLGIYSINELFSFLEYKKRLQVCSRSNRLSKILNIKKTFFRLYYFLIITFRKYNISALNLQNIYDRIFENFKKDLETKEINQIFSCFLQSLQNNPVKTQIVKISPLFNYYCEFLDIDCPEYELKLVTLYDIKKSHVIKNKKISSLDINFTVSSSMKKDILFLRKELNNFLSLNQYKNIHITIVGEGVFTKESFDFINLEKLEKLQLSFMDLSDNDINYFFAKLYDSHKKFPLISLDLSSNQLGDECINLLCWVIEINFPRLQKLNIYGNNFTSIGAEKILQKFHKTIEIDISLNKLGKEETNLFNKYNKNAKELKVISDFRFDIRNDFKENYLEGFYDKFKDLKIIEFFEGESIRLNKNQSEKENEIVEKQSKYISLCLNKMKKVEEINFNHTYKAGKILEKCNNAFLEQIKYYNLSYCRLTNKCLEITKKMKNLEKFFCFHTTLTNELIIHLNDLLKNNLINIRKLSLSRNNLNSKSVEEFIDNIKNLKHLLSFCISENDIGIKSIIQITRNLRDNCLQLIYLNISKTIEPHKEGLNELWDSISTIHNLSEFSCQDNYINSEDMALIRNKLPNSFIMLNRIDFSYNDDIDVNILNVFLTEIKKYLYHIETLIFWGVGKLNNRDLIKFRGMFPGRIRLRNKRK